MKKFLYNQARTKIFNLDMVVCIERPDPSEELIFLRFPEGTLFTKFAIYGNEEVKKKYAKEMDTIHPGIQHNGDFEVNHKLYQYFNHKFTHSALCQKTTQEKTNE